jgi:hypothetical protein
MSARRTILHVTISAGICLLAGCASGGRVPLHLDPSVQFAAIEGIEVLPPVDARADKSVGVNLHKQLLDPVTKQLVKKGYRVTQATSFGTAESISDEDLREADAEWVKGLGSQEARWVVIVCLVDVRTKMTFGSMGNAEISGYLFDRQTGTTSWRDKGLAQVGQGGLVGMMMKGTMDNSAISTALNNTLASFPKRPRTTQGSR